MRKLLVLLLGIVLLTGCASKSDDAVNETAPQSKEENNEVSVNEDESADPIEDERDEAGGEGFWTKYGADSIEEFYEKPEIIESLKIPTVEIESQFGEDGNYKYEHTEQEIVKDHMDETGRIYFNFDEYPVRSITSNEGKISNVMNYGDAYIDTLELVAYVIPDDHIEVAYDFFISNPPEELADKEASDYRTWEQATNLERGIIQIVELTGPLVNELGIMLEHDMYEGKGFNQILEEFENLGSPVVLIPSPQTVLDIQLFENMQYMKSLWADIGQFDKPLENKEDFDELYMTLRQETNNLIVRVNYTLSEDLPEEKQ